MLLYQICVIIFLVRIISVIYCIRPEENGKDLPNNSQQSDDLGRRRRPGRPGLGLGSSSSSGCNFNGIRKKPQGVYKTDGQGRTFFDLHYFNVGYNYQYNINCGGLGGGSNGHPLTFDSNKPLGGNGHHRPHKPNKPHRPFGNHGNQMGANGAFSNRPILSMIVANRPLQAIFGQSQAQGSQAQSGIISDVLSGFGSLLPSPQQFGEGLGQGISSFAQTIPQIGQSFQALLPNFGNFQSPTQGAQSIASNPAPAPTATTPDTDDIIYNDDVKPVHEDHDPITDPYIGNNKLPPGFNKNPNQQIYNNNRRPFQTNKTGQKFHYENSRLRNYMQAEGRSQNIEEGRTFRFPE